MTAPAPARRDTPSAVTLSNCDTEPIHIPGLVQPHGVLIAFDFAGRVTAWSDNIEAAFGFRPTPDAPLSSLPFTPTIASLLRDALAREGDSSPLMHETMVGGQEYDLVLHVHQGRIIAEFERRAQSAGEVAMFALKAHRAIERLKHRKSLQALLQLAVEMVREVTGFDRVMAYRFRHDESGDVVGEACAPDMEPFLGRRYPASDIPAQARRLYTINTLRLIADVNAAPVALAARSGDAPLDLSHSVLRSVSPIHIEYLQNMGVGASMSISIVVDGRLWGLIACHHRGARQVPYALRMACDVFAQVLASNVQSLEAHDRAAVVEQAAHARTALLESMLREDDILAALSAHVAPLAESLAAEALVATQQGKLFVFGDVPADVVAAVVAALPVGGEDLVERTAEADWPETAHPALGSWVGMLALQFDPASTGWLVALRREQVETVRWGGKPEKSLRLGPNGPRLTPRGSFEEWIETVRGKAEPWDHTRRAVARQLLADMYRACNQRYAELERTRTQLLAMLGHDLRDPLHTIRMAAHTLEMGAQAQTVGKRIQASSTRMQRLIGHVLDMSRIRGGLGLGLNHADVDFAALVYGLMEEWRVSHAGVRYEYRLPERLDARLDPDRITQVVSNLVSNARHHGRPGQPILVALEQDGDDVRLEVRNLGEPIAEAVAAELFAPFKRNREDHVQNRGGLGLGLYIAHEIVAAHGGRIDYRYEAPHVVFTVSLPRAPGSAQE